MKSKSRRNTSIARAASPVARGLTANPLPAPQRRDRPSSRKSSTRGAYWGDLAPALLYPVTGVAAARFTFWAENPLSPRMMSYSTTSPSFSARNPSPAMLLK
ncbi:MAG: hypothetical protein JWP03_1046 [Phycisphaerales bacterium]|nr:hypothetical protein [Phycisphaerales bacterium]